MKGFFRFAQLPLIRSLRDHLLPRAGEGTPRPEEARRIRAAPFLTKMAAIECSTTWRRPSYILERTIRFSSVW